MDFLDNLLNIKYENKNDNVSMSKALLLFYILVASNFTKNLYSGQLQDFLENSRLAQHLIGFITMLIVVVSVSGINEVSNVFLYSALGYGWFILTTKLDLEWNLVILGLLVFGFLYESKMVGKEKITEDDQALTEEEKDRIKESNTRMKTIVVISIVTITLIGSVQYFMKKKVQYGGEFDVEKFLFSGCKRYKLTS